jgi:hypothetical protein
MPRGTSAAPVTGTFDARSLCLPWSPSNAARNQSAYEALLARGKKKKVAIIAIMRRLLHVLWACFSTSKTLTLNSSMLLLLPHLTPNLSLDPQESI